MIHSRQDFYLSIMLFLLGILIYANSFPGNFYIDDVYIVERNPLVETMDLKGIFTTDYWGTDAQQEVLFRPLTILSFAVNKVLLGSEAWSFHLVNVLLHALVSVVLFRLLVCWGVSKWPALFAASLFAVHPIHGEVVNMMVGRSELLVALFFLIALHLASTNEPWRLATSIFFFLLALLAKEHSITFIAAIVLTDLFFGRKITKRIPWYSFMLILVTAWLLYRKYGLINGIREPVEYVNNDGYIPTQPLEFFSTFVRILTALKIQLLYLGNLILPVGLRGVYSVAKVAQPVTSLFSAWGGLICIIGSFLAVMCVYGWRRRKLWSLAILLYAVCFSVTSNIFFVSGVVMAERSAYLPSVWFCLGVVSLIPDPSKVGAGIRRAVFILCILLIFGLSFITITRNNDFRDPIKLWSKDFAVDPRNATAGINLIDAYVTKGDYDAAARTGEQILVFYPNDLDSLKMQSWLLVMDGRPEEAMIYAKRALKEMSGVPDEELIMIFKEIDIKLRRAGKAFK